MKRVKLNIQLSSENFLTHKIFGHDGTNELLRVRLILELIGDGKDTELTERTDKL